MGAGGTWATPVVPRSVASVRAGPELASGRTVARGARLPGLANVSPAPSTRGRSRRRRAGRGRRGSRRRCRRLAACAELVRRPEVLLVRQERPPTRPSPRLTDPRTLTIRPARPSVVSPRPAAASSRSGATQRRRRTGASRPGRSRAACSGVNWKSRGRTAAGRTAVARAIARRSSWRSAQSAQVAIWEAARSRSAAVRSPAASETTRRWSC